MNTANIKKYAPQARNAFITAVTKRANELGIYQDRIEEATEAGQTLTVEGRSVDLKLKAARNKLIQRVESTGFNPLMEQIAYTWFNRLCAIRFMELHDYLDHGLRVLSRGEGLGVRDEWGSPEILDHAQDVAEDLGLNREQIIELKLAGNQDEALYRLLLLGQCHALHKAMPFLFAAIDDETELLLPDNLIRTDSILRGLVDDIPAEDWQQVEIIGWLYQFYISEKKDAVIGKVVKSEDIPAATQLFTPNWIVKYLVQNSIGRQWLQSYPDSAIKAEMDYYIEPAQQTDAVGAALAAITPSSLNPEQLKILDPACGSGHILVEAYHTLKAIYAERGYRNRDIPKLILENNLYGLDIDDRAAQLTGFALMMLARSDDRRIFTRGVALNVMAMQSSEGLSGEGLGIREGGEFDGLPLIIDDIIALFTQAKTLGSLIRIPESVAEHLPTAERLLTELTESGDVFVYHQAHALLPLIKQAKILAQKYDAVIANPPYMGGKYQTPDVKKYLKNNFKGYEKDLFSAFIVRNLAFAKEHGQLGFMTPFVWMFISSYEELRNKLVNEEVISTLIQLEYSGFDGATVPICTFTLTKGHIPDYTGSYIKLSDFKGHQNQAPKTLEAIKKRDCGWFYEAKPDDFKKIPASPIAYWVSEAFKEIFIQEPIENVTISDGQNKTGNNDKFVREHWEVSSLNVGIKKKWFFYAKGGGFRRWYGNLNSVIDWSETSRNHYRKDHVCRIIPEYLWYKKGITWGLITSSFPSFRLLPEDATFDVGGSSVFFKDDNDISYILGILNTNLALKILKVSNPTLNFQVKNIRDTPFIRLENKKVIEKNVNIAVDLSENDWNTYETSWDFQQNPLIVGWVSDSVTQQIEATDAGLRDKAANPAYRVHKTVHKLADCYTNWQTQNRETIAEMQRLEQENNRLFIDAYGLQDELTPDVPLQQITLTVNPKYRYGGKLSDSQLENRFQSDTLAELISYFIGCVMARYRVDKAGLIYAHAGNKEFSTIYNASKSVGWVSDSVTQQIEATDAGLRDKAANPAYIENPFPADNDGIIPLTDQER